jgi:hypothetical protein
MSNGPIEFMGEEAGHDVPHSEYGGDDGLIQPEQTGVLRGDPAASGGHMLTDDAGERGIVGEKAGIAARVAMAPLSSREQMTGEADDEELVDPVTGRQIGVGALKAGGQGSGELSSLQP